MNYIKIIKIPIIYRYNHSELGLKLKIKSQELQNQAWHLAANRSKLEANTEQTKEEKSTCGGQLAFVYKKPPIGVNQLGEISYQGASTNLMFPGTEPSSG